MCSSDLLYGLKQAPGAWYDRLSKFLLNNNFSRDNVDTTLFIKRNQNDMLVIQIYVDDIIFGSTNESLCQDFAKLMQGEFEMSMMENLPSSSDSKSNKQKKESPSPKASTSRNYSKDLEWRTPKQLAHP